MNFKEIDSFKKGAIGIEVFYSRLRKGLDYFGRHKLYNPTPFDHTLPGERDAESPVGEVPKVFTDSAMCVRKYKLAARYS